MKQMLTFLGIETSCDETAASVVKEKKDGTGKILSNIVSSQFEEHKEFGGIVPEIAARAHIEKIDTIIKKAIEESNLNINELDGIAATAGPGLLVCLTVGLNIGKAIAASLNKPFIAINHLEGHSLSPKINKKIKFPYLLLLISGGHTQYLEVRGVNNYKRLGTTIDDALGEAFDKTAKLLGIELIIQALIGVRETNKKNIPASKTVDKASAGVYFIPPTTPKATKALMPIPGARPTGQVFP